MIKKAGKAFFILLAAVTVAFGLSLCSKALTADELVQRTTKAMENLKDYRVTMDGKTDIQAIMNGVTVTGAITTDATSMVDLVKKALRMEAKVSMASEDMGSQEFSMTMYSMEDEVYVTMPEPDKEPVWVKMKKSEATDIQSSALDMKQQLSILEGSEVKSLPDKNIEGIMSYGVEVTPDLQKTWRMIMRQPGMQDMESVPLEMLQKAVKDSSVIVWISKKDYYLTKIEYRMNLVVDESDMGQEAEQGGMTITATMSVRFYSQNKGLSIELPEEAKNAQELG